MNRPLILVVNDDGISSKGIRTLIKIMHQWTFTGIRQQEQLAVI